MATKKQTKDALEQVREMVIVNDKFQQQLSIQRKAAIELAEELYPIETSAGVQFAHKNQNYIVRHTKKWDFTHVTIDPIFNEWRTIVKEQKRLKKEYDALMKKILKRFPQLEPKSETKNLVIVR